jgi:hypothetical protein
MNACLRPPASTGLLLAMANVGFTSLGLSDTLIGERRRVKA